MKSHGLDVHSLGPQNRTNATAHCLRCLLQFPPNQNSRVRLLTPPPPNSPPSSSPPPPPTPGLPSPAPRCPLPSPQKQLIQMKTNGSSAKSQEIGSKRKRMNQDERTAKHIAYQQDVESRYIQDKKNRVITCLVCGEEGHYSCNCRFKDQEHEIVCTVCGKNGHCSMWCCQQNKSENRACTRCGEIGHSTSTHGLGCSSCDEYHDDGECRLSEVKCFICESQDHYLAQCPLNFQGALRLALSKQGNTSSAPAKCSAKSEGKVLTANKSTPICFTCHEEGHFAFQCPHNSPSQSEEFEESNTIATSASLFKELEEREPGTGTAKQSSEMKPILYDRCCPSKAKVLTPNKSSPIVRTCKTKTQGKKRMCFTCREEGHYAHMCPQRFGAISGNTSKEVEQSSTIATSSNMSKVLEEQDPGTAKQSSEMKLVRCLSCGQEGHRARSCPTRVLICLTCNEEGHKTKKCPTAKQSSEMKLTSVVRCVSCDQEGHRARSCPTRVFICSTCNEEGHKAKKCPQKHQKR